MPNQESDPNPDTGPKRKWLNGEPPIGTLPEMRYGIDVVDDNIVESLHERYDFVIGATLFKSNQEQVQAIERQNEVKLRAIERAKAVAPDDERFHKLIGDLWDILVPMFIEVQAEAFERTRAI